MSAFIAATVIGAGFLFLAIWVEIGERRGAPGDGDYRGSGKPDA
ncbi:MAG TPA: hypothetical protein VKY85_06810 [Candidatus Angelobacter sp.]|nr:hypothetical protein [Candidatus Angelobacter sp.]